MSWLLLLLSCFRWPIFIFVDPVIVIGPIVIVVGPVVAGPVVVGPVVVGPVVVGPIVVVVSPVIVVIGPISAPRAGRAHGGGGSGGDPRCPRKLEPKIQQKNLLVNYEIE